MKNIPVIKTETNRLTDEQLAAEISIWFETNKNDSFNLWNRTQTGRTIKKFLTERGNFKLRAKSRVGSKKVRVTEKVSRLENVKESEKVSLVLEKEKSDDDYKREYLFYEANLRNRWAEFKKNHKKRVNGEWYDTTKNYHVSEWQKKGFTDAVEPPPALMSFEEFVDLEKNGIF